MLFPVVCSFQPLYNSKPPLLSPSLLYTAFLPSTFLSISLLFSSLLSSYSMFPLLCSAPVISTAFLSCLPFFRLSSTLLCSSPRCPLLSSPSSSALSHSSLLSCLLFFDLCSPLFPCSRLCPTLLSSPDLFYSPLLGSTILSSAPPHAHLDSAHLDSAILTARFCSQLISFVAMLLCSTLLSSLFRLCLPCAAILSFALLHPLLCLFSAALTPLSSPPPLVSAALFICLWS